MVDHQVDCLVEKEVEGRRRRRGLSSVQLVIWNEKKTRVNGTVKGLKAQSSFSSAPASQNKTRAGLRFTSVLPSRRVSFSPFPAVDTLIVNPSLTPRYRPWTVQNSLAMINSVASERWLQMRFMIDNGEWANDSVKFRITLNLTNRGGNSFYISSLWNRGTKDDGFA